MLSEMNKALLSLVLLLGSTGCAQLPNAGSTVASTLSHSTLNQHISAFSSAPVGGLPDDWTPLIIFKTKKQTDYRVVAEERGVVLHAYAAEASSGLMQHVSIDPATQPWLNWQWKIASAVETATGQPQLTEDSPARIILGFDGDKDTLPFADQILFETAKVFTGHDFPYATLMYIWDKNAPIGTIMPSRRSGRIKMVVVANAASGIGQWQSFTRNIAQDFEAAYGEKPGKLIGVGVLTDTDNLGETVEAWYGDIHLRRDPK